MISSAPNFTTSPTGASMVDTRAVTLSMPWRTAISWGAAPAARGWATAITVKAAIRQDAGAIRREDL